MAATAIDTAAEAVVFLNAHGMEVICTVGGFIVREAGIGESSFEITCDDTEDLIAFARDERDITIGMTCGRNKETAEPGSRRGAPQRGEARASGCCPRVIPCNNSKEVTI